MSTAAEQYVTACTHPKVKGGVRALLTAIARHIPEGDTATPPIALDDLANTAQHTRRTAQTCRDILEAIGEVKVHDGGRGKVARYEIVNLSGARPLTTAPLPLIGRLKPRRTKEERSTSDLFSHVAAPTSEVSSYVAPPTWDLFSYVVRNIGSFFLRWWPRTKRQRSRWEISSYVSPAASIDRARDVHTVHNVHTHTEREESPNPRDAGTESRPPPPRHPWHAWCEGPMHVPKALHEQFLRTHARHPGQTDDDVAAELVAFYVQRSAAIMAHDRLPSDEFAFWRRAYAEEFSTEAPRAGPARRRAAPRPQPRYDPIADDVWSQMLHRIKGQINRHSFYLWFAPTALAHEEGDVIQVACADHISEWIQKHYRAIVDAAAHEVRPGSRVEFVSADEQQRKSG